MSLLTAKFDQLKSKGEKALVLYVMAGDPPITELPLILKTLEKAGADVIELGFPYSDPIADGPTIQASSQRSLDLKVTPTGVLEALSGIQLSIPVVVMGYYNPVLRFGLTNFAKKAKVCGVSGTILSDLTPEESEAWIEASRQIDLDTIFLTAPTSTVKRIDAVAQRSTGFVYAVSRTGVTGALQSVPADVESLVMRIKDQTDTPVCVGFGISKPEHVRTISSVADGAVIGSWLVDLLHREWKGGEGAAMIEDQVRSMKDATR